MIIFGTRGITYSKDKGSFFCPQCSDQRDYDRKRVRRFFTLYFIPLIPLDLVSEYVECGDCKGTFKPDVLEFDPAVQQATVEAEFQLAVKRVMALMVLADGRVDPAEIETVGEVYQGLTGMALSPADVEREVASARSDGRDVTHYLKAVAPMLNDEGKEIVVKAAYLVAAADGDFAVEEMALLQAVGSALELSSAHLKGVLQELREAPPVMTAN